MNNEASMVNPLQDIEYKIEISGLNSEKKEKLKMALDRIRIRDIERQGLELLFNIDNERRDITAYTLKAMTIELLILLTKDDVRKHIRSGSIDDTGYMLHQLITFFDHFDNDDFYLLRDIENLADYGEKINQDYPRASRTVDNIFNGKHL